MSQPVLKALARPLPSSTARTWRTLRERVSAGVKFVQDLKRIPEFVDASKTYYPEHEQKGRGEMMRDQFWACLRHGHLIENYYLYGFDRKGTSLKDFITYPEFRRLRDSRNRERTPFNYACLLEDKFIFGQLMRSLGHATPPNIALLKSGNVRWLDRRREEPLRALLKSEAEGICKPVTGIKGGGIFHFSAKGGQAEINGQPASLGELRTRLAEPYLLQEQVEQHEALSALHASSVNTLRLSTAKKGRGTELFSSALRMGSGNRLTDNTSAGGLVVALDPETGQTKAPGFFIKGAQRRIARHPDTGIYLDGYDIPYFHEAVELVRRVHDDLEGFHTVGWDVAITPEGPTLLEGNDNWGVAIPMAVEKNFKEYLAALFK